MGGMTVCNLPPSCQQKFASTTNCLRCGLVVDALVLLGDIAFCPLDRTCHHHADCAQEAARQAEGLPQGSRLKSRLLDRAGTPGSLLPQGS